LFPAQAEFEQYFQHLDKSHTDAKWPETGPGDPEGANVATPAGSIRIRQPCVDSESDRLLQVPLDLGTPAPTADAAWELGKRQRGAYDPISGALGSPSF